MLAKIFSAGEKSDGIRKRVKAARVHQKKRFKQIKIIINAEMNSHQVRELCPLESECRSLLTFSIAQMGLTARSYFKVIKVDRTIADLEGEAKITTNHLAEALQYRPQEEII